MEGLGLGVARRAARKHVPVVLTLGSGPSGFPRRLSGRRPKLPRQPWRGASLALASVILELGAGPLGFPKQLSGRRPKLPRQPWQTRAVVRARSVILALGAGPSGFPKQFSEASATTSLALASVVLALGSGRTGFPKEVSERRKAGGSWTPPRHMRPEAYVATRAAQIIKGEDQASGRNGRFINQKRTNGQIFQIRAADGRFHIVPYKEFISGQAEPFLSRAREANRRFIKAGQPQWPFY